MKRERVIIGLNKLIEESGGEVANLLAHLATELGVQPGQIEDYWVDGTVPHRVFAGEEISLTLEVYEEDEND